MSARDEILSSLRGAVPAPVPLPEVARLEAVRYPDVRERFARSVVEVGGRCLMVEGGLEDALRSIPEYLAASKVVQEIVERKIGKSDEPIVQSFYEIG